MAAKVVENIWNICHNIYTELPAEVGQHVPAWRQSTHDDDDNDEPFMNRFLLNLNCTPGIKCQK